MAHSFSTKIAPSLYHPFSKCVEFMVLGTEEIFQSYITYLEKEKINIRS